MATPRRRGVTDPTEDARARWDEEFRRCLIGVVRPSFEELGAALRREGRDVAVRETCPPWCMGRTRSLQPAVRCGVVACLSL